VIVDVDDSSLLAHLQAKSAGLDWGLAAVWSSVCIHQMNWLVSHNGLASSNYSYSAQQLFPRIQQTP